MDLERVVQVISEGRVYAFRVDEWPPLHFWRIETEGRPPCLTPLRALGDEAPAFFLALPRCAERLAR